MERFRFIINAVKIILTKGDWIVFLKKEVVNDRKTTRQSMEQFDRKKQCFYCGADASKDKKHPDRNIVHLATTIPFRNNILKLCEQKLNKGNFALFIGISIL